MQAALPDRLRANFDHDFGRQPQMMKLFVKLFGPYPLANGYTVVVTEDALEIPLEAQGISIFGANLAEYTDQVTGALEPYALPLTLDGVTVSFDVPSAKLSVPGYLTYVSPGQVNVQVPYTVAGSETVSVEVRYQGKLVGTASVPVAPVIDLPAEPVIDQIGKAAG